MQRQRYIQLKREDENENEKLKDNASGLDHRDGRKEIKAIVKKKK